MKHAQLPEKFHKKYKFDQDLSKKVSWKINSFEELGLLDPFPAENIEIDKEDDVDSKEKEEEKKDKNPKKLERRKTKERLKELEAEETPLEYSWEFVYPLIRIDKNCSPLTVYIPKKEIMFKIMRASIEVDTEFDFWFNRG